MELGTRYFHKLATLETYQQKYYRLHRSEILERNKKWIQDHFYQVKAYKIRNHRMWKYGLTDVQFNEILLAQDGKCAICGMMFNFEDKATNPHVDHDHKTNEIRGLLCLLCNLGIGKLGDDPQRLRDAANYLEDKRPWRP